MQTTVGRQAACVAIVGMFTALVTYAVRADYTVQRVLNGLNQPTYVTQAPGDAASLYIMERSDGNNQNGRIRKYDQMTGAFTTFLDVPGTLRDDGGAMSVTFHPDFQTNGLFYVLGTDNATSLLDEYRVVGGAPQFQRRILQYQHPVHVWHTINQVHFRPNGNNNELFVTAGDTGTQANEGGFNAALIESPTSVNGKLMRIDLTADFSTPASDATHSGISIVALGMRNPYRSAFDSATGDFYLGDVGFNGAEEVDYIPASQFANPAAPPLDFGWTSREGTVATVPSPPGGAGSPGDLNPIFDYPHPGKSVAHASSISGYAVVGGYLYRGPVTELQGRYFFAEHILGQVYSGQFDTSTDPATYNGTNLTDVVNHTIDFENRIGGGADIAYITSFGEDLAGNLYIVKIGTSSYPPLGTGEIFRVVPTVDANLQVEVSRDTGVISLTNMGGNSVDLTALAIGSQFGALNAAALTPISGHYDIDGTGTIDNNNAWTVTSAAGSHAELREMTMGDAGTIGPGQQITLSMTDGWIPSTTEDVFIGVMLDGGTIIPATVSYTGNGGLKFKRSDLDFDNSLDADDWNIYKAHHDQDLSSYSLAEAYGLGDLNADGKNDYNDFRLFKADYIATNGTAAFTALGAQIPEPRSLMLVAVCSIVLAARPRRLPQCRVRRNRSLAS